MKLYYFPNACSLGIHVILEETGATFELEKVDFIANAQYQADYLAVNPKSKVPALERDDGAVITEFPAIAYYLAHVYPEAKLFPEDLDSQTEVLETLDYLIATVHMRGFTRLFRPSLFAPAAADEEAVKEAGLAIIKKGFDLTAAQLDDKPYLVGGYSIADAALFFLEWWALTRLKIALPPALQGHLDRMLDRPAVQRALAKEGLA